VDYKPQPKIREGRILWGAIKNGKCHINNLSQTKRRRLRLSQKTPDNVLCHPLSRPAGHPLPQSFGGEGTASGGASFGSSAFHCTLLG
jgi:hypothetical protein